jgi:uncharacterized protein YegJ (DUF2314 family)
MRALLATAILALAACSAEPTDPEAAFERDLAEARQRARETLPFFWQRFAEPTDADFDFSLKAALPRRDGQAGEEEIWIDHIARAPDRIVGELAAQPSYLGDLRRGAIVDFQEGQVVDWAFFEGEKLLGHHTTRILLPRLESTQQEWLRAVLSTTPTGDGP